MPQPLPRFLAELEKREDLRRLVKILAESGDDTNEPGPVGGTSGGDWERLRGLPAVGRGVSGAIRGTDPARETIRRDSRRQH